MLKSCRLEIRLSNSELDIIKSTASKFDMKTTDFILSILIPYCAKHLTTFTQPTDIVCPVFDETCCNFCTKTSK